MYGCLYRLISQIIESILHTKKRNYLYSALNEMGYVKYGVFFSKKKMAYLPGLLQQNSKSNSGRYSAIEFSFVLPKVQKGKLDRG